MAFRSIPDARRFPLRQERCVKSQSRSQRIDEMTSQVIIFRHGLDLPPCVYPGPTKSRPEMFAQAAIVANETQGALRQVLYPFSILIRREIRRSASTPCRMGAALQQASCNPLHARVSIPSLTSSPHFRITSNHRRAISVRRDPANPRIDIPLRSDSKCSFSSLLHELSWGIHDNHPCSNR